MSGEHANVEDTIATRRSHGTLVFIEATREVDDYELVLDTESGVAQPG